MKRLTLSAGLIGAIAVGFAGGYFVRANVTSSEAARELEDQALQALQRAVATAHYVRTGDTKTLTEVNDVHVYGALRQLDENQGHINDPRWIRAKVKTLNAIALYWENRAPFDNASWREKPEEWTAEWEQGHSKNLALLQWAKAECINHPEYECKKAL
jgi:hypothetical protein